MKTLVVLLGIHGSGKTTLGAALPADRFAFFSEIGTAMRARVNEAVIDRQDAFDDQVMSQELERDARLLTEVRLPVVETWHLGNIAFAMARGSRRTVAQYRLALRQQLTSFDVFVVQLLLSDQEFLNRATEKKVAPGEALGFYRAVERHQSDILEEFLGARQPTLALRPPWHPEDAAALLSSVLAQ